MCWLFCTCTVSVFELFDLKTSISNIFPKEFFGFAAFIHTYSLIFFTYTSFDLDIWPTVCSSVICILISLFFMALSFSYSLILDSHFSKKKLFYLLQWKPFKNDEKCILFHVKSSSHSQDNVWEICVWIFLRLTSKTSQSRQQTITIHILPNISQSKESQRIKFGQLLRARFFFKSHAGTLAPDVAVF